jgi:hypothetical protein
MNAPPGALTTLNVSAEMEIFFLDTARRFHRRTYNRLSVEVLVT